MIFLYFCYRFFFFVKKYKIKLDFSKKNYYTIKHKQIFTFGGKICLVKKANF